MGACPFRSDPWPLPLYEQRWWDQPPARGSALGPCYRAGSLWSFVRLPSCPFWTHSDCPQQEANECLLVIPRLASSTSGRLGRPLDLRWRPSGGRLLRDPRMRLPPVPGFLRPGVLVCGLDSLCPAGRRALSRPSARQTAYPTLLWRAGFGEVSPSSRFPEDRALSTAWAGTGRLGA